MVTIIPETPLYKFQIRNSKQQKRKIQKTKLKISIQNEKRIQNIFDFCFALLNFAFLLFVSDFTSGGRTRASNFSSHFCSCFLQKYLLKSSLRKSRLYLYGFSCQIRFMPNPKEAGQKKSNSKKHIGILHYTLPPAISGVEMVIRDHARLLSTYGYKVYLLGASGKKFRSEIEVQLAKSFDPKNEKVLRVQEELKKQQVSKSFYELKKKYVAIIKKWIDKNKLDVIIVHNVLSRHYNLALTAAITEVGHQRKNVVKNITWVHDASFIDTFYTQISEHLKQVYPWTLIAEYQKDFIYVTVSQTRKLELKLLYGKDKKIIVVPNGIDINKMLPLPLQTRNLYKDVIRRNPDYIGLIPVRITERKNIEYAIELVKVAKEKFQTNFTFLVTGALHLQNAEAMKYYEYLRKKIKEDQLEQQFFFLYDYKFTTGEKFDIYKLNIRDLYLISDFLFIPSKGEGFGLPIIEAGFMRIPIFAANLPVFKEVGNGYVNVFRLEDSIETSLKGILAYLKKSRSTIYHKIVLKQYSLEEIVKTKLIPLLEENAYNHENHH